MKLFKPPVPPNTISDEKMAKLQERARKANPHLDRFDDPEAVKSRLAVKLQHDKRNQS